MSRPTWHVSIEVKLINGSRGTVSVSDDDLVTFRDVQEVFQRALTMASQLNKQPNNNIGVVAAQDQPQETLLKQTMSDANLRYPRAV